MKKLRKRYVHAVLLSVIDLVPTICNNCSKLAQNITENLTLDKSKTCSSQELGLNKTKVNDHLSSPLLIQNTYSKLILDLRLSLFKFFAIPITINSDQGCVYPAVKSSLIYISLCLRRVFCKY